MVDKSCGSKNGWWLSWVAKMGGGFCKCKYCSTVQPFNQGSPISVSDSIENVSKWANPIARFLLLFLLLLLLLLHSIVDPWHSSSFGPTRNFMGFYPPPTHQCGTSSSSPKTTAPAGFRYLVCAHSTCEVCLYILCRYNLGAVPVQSWALRVVFLCFPMLLPYSRLSILYSL